MSLPEGTTPAASAAPSDAEASRTHFSLHLAGRGAAIDFARDAFDSSIFRREIGRIRSMQAADAGDYPELVGMLVRRARSLGYAQVLRRVPASDLAEVWALERAGFELMDIGVTFARTLAGPIDPPADPELVVARSTGTDIEQIVGSMLEIPWGSRYEADPEYSEDAVRELRTQWLWNSHRGRAAAVLVGRLDDDAAGYVTCLLDEPTGHGEIELVGTLPRFRGRRVAHRLLQHAVSWFSTRATRVTVRTQATNFAAAALYEKAGFTLAFSDLTFRLSLAAR